QYEDGVYKFVVEPAMIDNAGNFAQGVLTEFIKDISVRVLTKKHQKNIIIEQLMLYFVQAVQIDDCLVIRPRVITEKRRSSVIDFEILLEEQIVAKALVTTKIN
ncbi:MAG: hypothetical protein Q4E30_06145, partial [Streptococcus gallolyticus]|nr:hypothetical protein [Streptococcus gallolyticus]